MAPTLTKVIFKPDTQSSEEYFAIVNPQETRKYQCLALTLENSQADVLFFHSSIPLANVVESFEIFHSGTGSQGLYGRPSKQQLDTVFGTSKDVDVIEHILKHGREQKAEGPINHSSNKNISIGSAASDSARRAGFN
ncbi:hypothetical protein CVT24_011485 [Panaeolus cyanescens]|uniref:Ribosome maturation protein SDO1/SBDS N-terminal domain-containing protein n=1 Tax=Panaeolus cyanescens TaxID=181874 RepID=A0A409VGL9_9AGAR|nr:hypothetical protein CVT24_011485 [Panaeolus cyanescens]